MAVPPWNTEIVEKAASLGWVSKRQARKALNRAFSMASVDSPADALATLREMGYIDKAGIDAVRIGRPAPVPWWCFWSRRPRVSEKTIEQNIIKQAVWSGRADETQIRTVFTLFPDDERDRLLSSYFLDQIPEGQDGDPEVPGFTLIKIYRDTDVAVAAWKSAEHILLTFDPRPRWSLSVRVIAPDAELTLTEVPMQFSSIRLELKDRGTVITSVQPPKVELDMQQRISGVQAVITAVQDCLKQV